MLLLLTLACTSTQAYFSTTGDDLEAVSVGEISAATETVHVAIFTFTSLNLQGALEDAADRGVEVYVVADDGQAWTVGLPDPCEVPTRTTEGCGAGDGACGRTEEEASAAGTGGNGIMHDKFAIIDGQTVLTGSFNWTPSANYVNDENLLVLHSRRLADSYEEVFRSLWGRSYPYPCDTNS